MRFITVRRPLRANGFTLIELAVVVAIIAILSAAFVPDLIEASRTRMAQKAAEDVAQIHSAGQWYFTESVSAGAPDTARWPGEGVSPGGASDGNRTCVARTGVAPKTPQEQLVAAGYLQGVAFTNPWGNPYLVTLNTSVATPTPVCGLRVSTALPTAVANAFTSFLPNAACTASSDCAGGTPTDTSCCTSTIPKPGGEAPFQYLTNTWIPANVYTEQVAGTYAATTNTFRYCSCVGRTNVQTPTCQYHDEYSKQTNLRSKSGPVVRNINGIAQTTIFCVSNATFDGCSGPEYSSSSGLTNCVNNTPCNSMALCP